MFRLIEWRDSWPWALVNGVAFGLSGAALWRAYVTTGAEVPAPALVSMGLSLAAFAGITTYRYVCRWRWIKSIAFYTRQGVAVRLQGPLARARAESFGPRFRLELDDAIGAAVGFWWCWLARRYAASDKVPAAVDRAIDRAVLTVVDEPFELLSSSGPVEGAAGMRFLGLHHAGHIVVAWDGDRVKTLDDLGALVRHEMGHLVLEAAGIGPGPLGESHHKIFAEEKYGA
jgi:hypothetical protein